MNREATEVRGESLRGFQPVRTFVLEAAGRVVRGERVTRSDRVMLQSFRSMFPGLGNPVEIACSKPEHRLWSVLLFPDEIDDFGHAGQLSRAFGRWQCDLCGNGELVTENEIEVF